MASYARPPYAPNNYGRRPFIPYPNANDKWKNESNLPTNSNGEKPQDKSLAEQVANHASLIKELQGSITSISNDIRGLQQQAAGIDKALYKLADNQATLLSMTAGKPQGNPTVGMNSISVREPLPTTFEDTYNELLDYVDILEPLLLQFGSLT